MEQMNLFSSLVFLRFNIPNYWEINIIIAINFLLINHLNNAILKNVNYNYLQVLKSLAFVDLYLNFPFFTNDNSVLP